MKKYQIFLSENFQFLEVKFPIYLNRRVFVMVIGRLNSMIVGTDRLFAVIVALCGHLLYYFIDVICDVALPGYLICYITYFSNSVANIITAYEDS